MQLSVHAVVGHPSKVADLLMRPGEFSEILRSLSSALALHLRLSRFLEFNGHASRTSVSWMRCVLCITALWKKTKEEKRLVFLQERNYVLHQGACLFLSFWQSDTFHFLQKYQSMLVPRRPRSHNGPPAWHIMFLGCIVSSSVTFTRATWLSFVNVWHASLRFLEKCFCCGVLVNLLTLRRS